MVESSSAPPSTDKTVIVRVKRKAKICLASCAEKTEGKRSFKAINIKDCYKQNRVKSDNPCPQNSQISRIFPLGQTDTIDLRLKRLKGKHRLLAAAGKKTATESRFRTNTWIKLKHEILQVMLLVLSDHDNQCSLGANVQPWKYELFKETLILQNGACLYELRGLRPRTWYEVKISYPASIPASFSLQLSRGTSDLGLNRGRKLLNTEKLIFKTDEIPSLVEQGRMYVLLNVEPEGVVAIPGKQERDYITFNIVCDELLLGIPHKAWFVVALVLVCLVFAFVVPSFLPPFLLPEKGNRPLCAPAVTKDS
ncbi:hypothetical protein STAS_01205 [Striga asiatica]|uniref:Uncharacterized protein n=1 Tax=Striga asiatica TaxID=4170 RepID=A0A5A7NZ15_STRAF|nr:hypothetical protein STAS_01205 [Striga asiatica]